MPVKIITRNTIDKKNQNLREVLVFWQAHQSTSTVMPENTMRAFKYAWDLGGIPEGDIRTSKDGVIICLHDSTLERTTDVSDDYKNIPVRELNFEQIRCWDAGVKTGTQHSGERIPSLEEVFEEMKPHKERLFYLDLKDACIERIGKMVRDWGLVDQVIFIHNKQESCIKIKEVIPDIRTMLWISGSPSSIKGKFLEVAEGGFKGLNQVQLHLYDNKTSADDNWPHPLELDFVQYAYDRTKKANITLEVLTYTFTDASIHTLLDMGIRWFAVDHPEEFIETVKKWGQD